MQAAIDAFQRRLFILLLYVAGYGLFILDFFTKNRTAFYGVLDVLVLGLGITSLSSLRGRLGFIVLFIISCFVINLSYSEASLFSSFNGFREILIILCMVTFYKKVFAEGNEEMTEDYINIVKNFGYVFLIMQIPAAGYQFIMHGPSDKVGGTLGNWGSGVLTLTVVCFIYFLHFFSRNITVNILLYITLIPLFLNETKISFILIPMMILFIWVKLQAKNIILGIGGAVVAFLLFNNFFSASYIDFDNNAAGIFSKDFLSDYLMADIYTYDDIPRFTKIILAWNFLTEQTNTFLFGMEYGLFKGTGSGEFSSFIQTYYWLLIGTRPYLFFLLMQGGIMLVIGFLWLYFHVNKVFINMNKFKTYLFLILLLILCYNDVLRTHSFVALYFFFVFYANSPLYNKDQKI